MTRPRKITVAALTAALALTPAAAMGQQSVEECIAQGGPRYGVPDDATIHQYVDAGGRCADAQDEDEVTITPVGDGDDVGTPGGAQPGAGTTVVTPPTSPNTQTGGGGSTEPSPGGGTQPGTGGSDPATTGARGPEAASAVQAALAAGGQVDGASLPASVGSLPGGITALVLAALGLAGVGVGARRLGRN